MKEAESNLPELQAKRCDSIERRYELMHD